MENPLRKKEIVPLTNKNQKTHHNPGTTRKEIKDTSEKALQRAIWHSESTVLDHDKGTVKWIDFELPVNDSGKARDNCIDLLGIDSSGNYVICEVKYSGKGKGHGDPSYASAEVKRYDDQIRQYGSLFKLHKNNKRSTLFSLDHFLSSKHRLLVVGDQRYWNIWGAKFAASPIIDEIEHYSISVSNDEFVKQRMSNGGGYYRPKMPPEGIVWHMIKH